MLASPLRLFRLPHAEVVSIVRTARYAQVVQLFQLIHPDLRVRFVRHLCVPGVDEVILIIRLVQHVRSIRLRHLIYLNLVDMVVPVAVEAGRGNQRALA